MRAGTDMATVSPCLAFIRHGAAGSRAGSRAAQSRTDKTWLISAALAPYRVLYGMAWRHLRAFPGRPCPPGCEGKTWLTQDLSTGALWAVKMVRLPLHTKMVQAIFREIRIQAELGEGHINIITPQVGGGGSGGEGYTCVINCRVPCSVYHGAHGRGGS